jgi:nucleotide-binding universal stress UspA family protein
MPRKIVLATDLAKDSERALDWVLKNVYKSGDQFHIVHVAKLKDETSETFHGPVGSSFHYHEKTPEQTNALLEERKQYIATKINPRLDKAGVAHETHLFLEGENATASEVAAVVQKVYEQEGGDLLVASRSNKTWSERFFIGSVAESLSKLPHPLILVTTAPGT